MSKKSYNKCTSKGKEVQGMDRKLVYIAKDGKEFDDEEDCLLYETDLRIAGMEGKVHFFGLDKEPLPLTLEGLQAAYFMDVQDESVLAELDETLVSIPEFCGTGLYIYDEEMCEWVSLEKEIKRLLDLKKELGVN